MTTEATEQTQNPNAELKAFADRLKTENLELRSMITAQSLDKLGLDPSTGIGKAIVKDLSREKDFQWAPDAIAKYAKEEYGFEAAAPEPAPEATSKQEEVTTGIQQAEAALGVSTSQEVTPQQERISALQSAMLNRENDKTTARDLATQSLVAKADLIREAFNQ